MQTMTRHFGFERRQDVADAFMERINSGELPLEIGDEIIPRLLPECYPDTQDWYSRGLTVEESQTCTKALTEMIATDRLPKTEAARAGRFLGIITSSAA